MIAITGDGGKVLWRDLEILEGREGKR